MNTTGLVKYAGALVALAICAACGGTFPQARDEMTVAPSTRSLGVTYVGGTAFVNGVPVTAARPNPNAVPRFAILPVLRAKSKYYEYIFNDYGTYGRIFDYPKSDAQIGSIAGAGGQGCTNVLYGYGKKIFWNVGGYDQITEYKIPKKPLKTLSVPYSSIGSPSSCAMDGSGDLAVGILYGAGGGDIVIFKNASGQGTVYTTPLAREYFDGYDPNGNLFFDGLTGTYRFDFLELPEGSTQIKTIETSNTVRFPGSVQWDGTYLAVTDQVADAIYRYTVRGTKAMLKGKVSLSGAGDCAQTWIATGIVFCADAGNEDGEVFKYPAGGSPIATFTGNFDLPLGTVAAER
jgi:hypothetical protein